MTASKTERIDKGRSIVVFPNDYIVIDIETTGLSPQWDSIIEISGIRVENNVMKEQFSTLVKPEAPIYDDCYIDPFIEDLTGISNEMLRNAPSTDLVVSEFKKFIGDSILIGHNVSFDINFLYDNFEKYLNCPLTNDFVNTMRISRRLHPKESNSLSSIAERYHVDYTGAHRALRDCFITKSCLDCMKDEILETYPDFESFSKTFKKRGHGHSASGHYLSHDRISEVEPSEVEPDDTNPIYNKVIVFTGALETMTRKAAMQMVENCGGINGGSVTKKTNYLVLGNNDYCSTIKDGKSAKQKRAEQLKLDGYEIEIIPENVFLDMVNEQE